MSAFFQEYRNQILLGVMAGLLVLVAVIQSLSVSLTILNLCLISAIMALGVNIQWGYAGLFNVGVMGFAALRPGDMTQCRPYLRHGSWWFRSCLGFNHSRYWGSRLFA